MGLPTERVDASDEEVVRAETRKILGEFRDVLKGNPAFNSALIEEYWKKPYINSFRFLFNGGIYDFTYCTDGYGNQPSMQIFKYSDGEDSPTEGVRMLRRADDHSIYYMKRVEQRITYHEDNHDALSGAKSMLEDLKPKD